MKCKKPSLLTFITIWGILLIIILSASLITIDIVSSVNSANNYAEQMQKDFTNFKREQIKAEVIHLTKIINYQLNQKKSADAITTQQNQEKIMQLIVAQHVTNHRFGKTNQGYIFIYKLLDIHGGDKFAIMYANPNRPDLVGKYIADNIKDAHGKEFRKEFLKEIRSDGESSVDYWYKKINDPNPSPKTSYFKLTYDGQYIIAAGGYLNEVDTHITTMKAQIKTNLKEHILIFLIVAIGMILIVCYLSKLINNHIKNNFEYFTDFFKQATDANTEINRSLIRFSEFDQLAHYANQMLHDKNIYVENLNQYKQLLDTICLVSKGDLDGDITYVNKSFCKISGYHRDELIGQPHSILRHPSVPSSVFKKMWELIQAGRTWRGIAKNKNKAGKTFYADSVIAPLINPSGDITEYLAARYDITELLEKRDEVKLAFATDNLTSLASRHKLIQDIASATNTQTLLLLDIDDFSGINNQLGSEVSDQVLKHISNELITFFENDHYSLYRLHSDVFAILTAQLAIHELIKQCDYFYAHLSKHPFICAKSANIKPIIITLVGGLADTQDNLINCADIALLRAKQDNLPYLEYSPELDSQQNEGRTYWINQIQLALQEHRLLPHYQPIVSLATGKVVKYEALMRMVDQEGQIVPPGKFLPILERTRYYPQMTQSIVKQACSFFSTRDVSFSVNLSVDDLLQQQTIDYIISITELYGVTKRIVIEVVETENIQNYDSAIQSLNHLKSLGMKIGIDDFGSGYSNFSYLAEFPADFVKIDGSLISKINSDAKTQQIVKMLIDYAHSANMEVIAEYVSDEDILQTVTTLGCDYGQGFHLGRPVAGDQIN